MKFDLAKLRALALPRCTFDGLLKYLRGSFTAAPGVSEEQAAAELQIVREAVDKQVQQFAAPSQLCIGCDRHVAGFMGTFTWGLASGEGFCGACGYPMRGQHYAPKGGPGLTFRAVLQYHPDELHERQPEIESAVST